MALIAKIDEYIILSAQRNIFVWNTKDQTHSLTQVPKIPRKIAENNNAVKNGKSSKSENNDNEENADDDRGGIEFGDINRLTISPSNHLVAVTTIGDKFLFLYQMSNGSLNLMRNLQLNRATSVVRFTPDSKHLLIADKTGDCCILDCSQLNQANGEAKWILGHLSIVLDVLMTSDLKYIVSSDRDEKIRVTNYPQTEVIESYCMGHVEYVSAIEELKTEQNENVLVSISGDKTLRLWKHIDGKELFRLELPARGLRLVRNSQNGFAVVSYDENISISIFELTTKHNQLEICNVAEHELNDNVKYISSIVYESNDSIWFSGLDENNELLLKRLEVKRSGDEIKVIETDLENVFNMLKENLTSTTLQPCEDIAQLLKTRIDNTADYHERKRRRIELRQGKFQ